MSMKFIGSLPESLTQGLLVGKLLVGGLGVPMHGTITIAILAFPLVAASKVGGLFCRYDPHAQTLLLFICQ